MYRSLADGYDRRVRISGPYRRRAIDRLALGPGDTVIDVACGTGINFTELEERIGPSGRLVGVDLSGEMLAHARRRVERHAWDNVTLSECAVEDMALGVEADAALFSLTHDVLQSDAALEAVLRHLRPGAGIAAFGAKRPPRWNLPVGVAVWLVARSYVTTFEGFDRPWRGLERLLPNLAVESVGLSGAYLAWGTLPMDQRDALTLPSS